MWRNAHTPRPRHLLAGSGLLALMLLAAACSGPVVSNQPPSGGTPVPINQPPPTGTIYIRGGALRASDGTLRWAADLGVEPPLIDGGVAYVMTLEGSDSNPQQVVRAVRLADGKQLWLASLPPVPIEAGPMTLTGNGLLVIATDQYSASAGQQMRLLALRASDGSQAWQSALVAVVTAPTVDTPMPFVSRLAFAGGRIVALADTARHAAFAAAWNASDGSLAWRIAVPHASDYAGAGATLTIAGALLLAAYGGADGAVIGRLDVAAGAWMWTRGVSGAWQNLITANVVVVSDNSTGSITALRPQDGTTLWTQTLGAGLDQMFEDMAASDTTIFYGNFVACAGSSGGQTSTLEAQVGCQQIYAVNLADGKVLWQHQFGLNQIYNAAYSVYGAGVLYYHYFTSGSGTSGTGGQQSNEHFVLVALRSSDGQQLWTHETGALLQTLVAGSTAIYSINSIGSGSPAGACGIVLTAYSQQDGSRLWQQPYTPCGERFAGPFLRFPWIVLG